jgi:hypothetical protein
MSISKSGLSAKSKVYFVSIQVPPAHPLIVLRDLLPWEELYGCIEEDLKKTKKGKFFTGPQLQVRPHLGAYTLQQLYNLTDRKTEYMLRDNAAAQIFCGVHDVAKWHSIDHTKIEKFRSRLTPETQKKLNDIILKKAFFLGFTDPSKMDVDSTVQEAYPSDANMLARISQMSFKVRKYLSEKILTAQELMTGAKERMRSIKGKLKEYLFRKPKKSDPVGGLAKKKKSLQELAALAREEVDQIANLKFKKEDLKKMPWNIRQTLERLQKCWVPFILGVYFFIENNRYDGKSPRSFHLEEISCFNKGKATAKGVLFGRHFQLGRIGGNFLTVASCTHVRMEDKSSLKAVVKDHQNIFGPGKLKSIGTDKGYFSKKNLKFLGSIGLEEMCLQMPGFSVEMLTQESDRTNYRRLVDRRAGVEPLIGHTKHGGQLGKSRMKKDATSIAAGYGAVLGLNLRQMIRHAVGKKILAMT